MPNPERGVLELGSLLLYGIAFTYAHQKEIKDIYVGLTKLDAPILLKSTVKVFLMPFPD
jgi:hypothetical protein